MPTLSELQAAFAEALEGEDAGALEAQVRENGLAPSRRIAVYRNNTRITQAEALGGVYPAIKRLLGEEFFLHMADVFAAVFPSRSGDLRRYGGELAEFLEQFPPTASLAYLPDVARLEWAWHEAFHAPFSEVLDAQALAQLPQGEWADLRLELQPSARLLRSTYPAAKIWEFALSEHGPNAPRLDLGSEAPGHVLVVRPQLEVLVVDLEPAEWRWLNSLAAGAELAAARELARSIQGDADCEQYLNTHLEIGSFAAFT